jgi:hypothetical protein
MYFMFPKSVCILLKINFNAFKVFVVLLLVFHKFLEPKIHFTLQIDSNIHDIQTTPLYLMTEII